MTVHTFDNGEFWLYSEFFTDDDILMGKENFNKNGLNSVFGSNFALLYDFGSYSHVEFVLSGSPQSMLNACESPNGPSPPTTPP
ncbi:hypothetical protein CsSME_00034749 [Camellia sinensis var. sinensis]